MVIMSKDSIYQRSCKVSHSDFTKLQKSSVQGNKSVSRTALSLGPIKLRFLLKTDKKASFESKPYKIQKRDGWKTEHYRLQ